MHSPLRSLLALTTAAVIAAPAAAAQQPAAQAAQRAGVMGELMKDVSDVQQKLRSLAGAMPVASYEWRPSPDVRSVGEVYLHLSSDNYFIPAAMGTPADPATGITATDVAALTKFEKQKLSREATVEAMDKSFAHLLKAMGDTPDAKLDEKVTFFGQQMTRRQVWIATVSHLHEHLGQAIAYARMNGVVPPWSRTNGG